MMLASELHEQLPNIELPVVLLAYNGQYHTVEKLRVVGGHIVIDLKSADQNLQRYMESHQDSPVS